MTTGFTSFDSSEKFNTSRVKLLDNDKNALTWNADTAFPTNGVANGMPCFRTDENKLYVRVSGAWSDFVGFGTGLTFNKNVTVNGDLEVTGKIIGVNADGYGTCSTAAGTAEKVVDCENYELDTGVTITVKFTVTNTAANPTLNVNGTGAKPIYYRGSAIKTEYLEAGRTYQFIYNGTQYELVGDVVEAGGAVVSGETKPVSGGVVYTALRQYLPLSGGTVTGAVTFSAKTTTFNSCISFTDTQNPYIYLSSGGVKYYLQSSDSQVGLGPTWGLATVWNSAGEMTVKSGVLNCTTMHGTADAALKATKDGDENVISTTYQKKVTIKVW